jgi:streptogramin lyase
MKLRSPLLPFGLFLLAALAAACGGSGGSGGVPTIAPSASATPTATTTPGTGPTASATISYPAGGGAVAMPPVSNFSGTINLTAATSGGGAQTSIATQAYSPAGLPVIQVKRRATSQSNDPLLYISFTATTALTLSGYPGFAITLPETVSTDGTFSLVFYDPTHASLGWQLVAGPVIASGQVVTFAPGSTPVTFAANQTYVFAIYVTPNEPSPSPTSSPTGGATATPLPAAVPQLSATSFPVDSGFYPISIVAASDGNLWFTECPNAVGGSGAIDKMTTAGVLATYPLTGGSARCPYWIVNGPDGTLWFTEYLRGSGTANIGNITLTGTITEYPVAQAQSYYLAVGSDQNLWYTQNGSVSGFNPTTHLAVGSVTMPPGYSAGFLANNPTTGDMLVSVIPSSTSAPPQEVLSFTPGSSPMLTTRYSASSDAPDVGSFSQFALGSDGNFYGGILTNNSTGAQQMLQLAASNYAANYVNLPQSFIFGSATVDGDFNGPTVFAGGNVYFQNGDPDGNPRGMAELSTSGIILGQANTDSANAHAEYLGGAVGPDGNIWITVWDLESATPGWIERIVPASSSGSSMRVRR